MRNQTAQDKATPHTPNAMKNLMVRARMILLWERAAPSLSMLLMILGSYAASSWFAVWLYAPPWLKILGLVFFVSLTLVPLVRLIRLTSPTSEEIIARIESVSGVDHRPLTTALDEPVLRGTKADTTQAFLWRSHQARMAKLLSKMRTGWPHPVITHKDPYALRAIVILLAFVGFNVAGSDRMNRFTDIFDFSVQKGTIASRLDAWVTPPLYTSKPPIFLTRDTVEAADKTLDVPEGSQVSIRLGSSHRKASTPVITFQPADGEPVVLSANIKTTNDASSQTNDQLSYQYQLTESGSLSISNLSTEKVWTFNIRPDHSPTIAFAGNPTVQRSGAIQVVASLSDDYGVAKAEALFVPNDASADAAKKTRPLYEAPKFPLTLSRGQTKNGTSKTLRSIVEHPWAGASVTMTLKATDQLGQEGFSNSIDFILPQRHFSNPIAKAIIEQRRALALDANYRDQLVDILDVLTIRPEQFGKDYAALIALSAIRRGLLNARDDDDLRQAVDALWDLAIGLEDGNLSDAERALRDALEALREGIEKGASDEELARLMDQARQALNEFMQALAEQAQQQGNTADNQPSLDPSQILNSRDLQEMLDRIGDLAQTGSRDAAQQLLSELQQMMENLQANNQQQGQRGLSDAERRLNELGDMIREQQQLMDETFRQQGQESQPGNQPGTLEQGQGQLAERLQRFLEGLGQEGEGTPQDQLGNAQRSMRGATGELGEGDLRGAGQQQAEALEQLRRGAQALSEQMAGEGEGENGVAEGNRSQDPLGRREGRRGSNFGDDVEVPNEVDTQRAREILDAIRKRLGEPLRPQIELDYLERLLRSQ